MWCCSKKKQSQKLDFWVQGPGPPFPSCATLTKLFNLYAPVFSLISSKIVLLCCCCYITSVMSDSCDRIDGSPPGSSIPRILQAGTLEWVAVSFSNASLHAKSLQLYPTVQPYGQQPTRLLCPHDSLGKNTGVGCHFLLQVLLYNTIIWFLRE